MAGSKGKSFPFKHCWALLQHLDKWKLRDQESAPKKSDMLKMDDSDEEGRNHDKPGGTKKAKERMKMEAEASSQRRHWRRRHWRQSLLSPRERKR